MPSSTTSVSTGTGGGFDLLGGRGVFDLVMNLLGRFTQVEMADLVAAITVKAEALASQTRVFRISADNFDDAFEAAEKRQAGGVQADQHLAMRERFAVMSDHDRHFSGARFVAATMRHEGGGGIVPQQLVQRHGGGLVRGVQQHAQSVLHGLVAELAGGAQLVVHAAVKINFGHIICQRGRG